MSTSKIEGPQEMAATPSKDPRRPAETQRRTPSTERSRELVRKVLEATAQVLDEVGVEGASTNKIAQRAGVAIGSIYQYFPDKTALYDALVDDRIRRLEMLVADRMAELRTHRFPEASEAMLRGTVDFHAREPVITPLLAARTSAVRRSAQLPSAEARVHAIARDYLEGYADELTISDLDLAATICMQVVLHFAPLIAMLPSGSQEQEAFIIEIARMLSAWTGAE